MSLASGTGNNPAIDSLIQSSLKSEKELLRLEWFSSKEITNIKPTQIYNNVYCASHNGYAMITLLLLGSDETCTPTLVSEFARIYSLPTHKYKNDVSQFRRYSTWLERRNKFIKGFTKYKDKYYMVADSEFYHCYSRYGFCSACRILRCSPVWCTCGLKQLSDGWTINNKKLDQFINKSQLQTNSPNDAYLEWIPFDCIDDSEYFGIYLYGLPAYAHVTVIPLETHDLCFAKVNYVTYASRLLNSLNNYY